MENTTILVIDDEKAQLETLAGFLKKRGYEVRKAGSAAAGLEFMKSEAVDLILTDFKMPDKDGLTVLREAKQVNPEVDVIVMTAYGSIESATEAMKSGALDYLTKPIDLEHLEMIVEKAVERRQLLSENRELREQLGEKFRFAGIISTSPEMETVLNTAGRVAATQATVLIRGESGTGKELVARAIHYASPRRERSFIAVNCAALSENLLESELFGHEKGAFTGADRERKGRFELARGGTLFLDEIGEIPLSIQVKLLRVLQEKSFERVGGSETIQVDVRLIAATNRDLEQMLQEKTFRDDLYYRLNVVSIEIPPLRARKTDVPLLAEHFLHKYTEIHNKRIDTISKEAMDKLLKYPFPGNVRELENVIEQAVVLARHHLITTGDLPANVRGVESEQQRGFDSTTGRFQERVSAFEKQLIEEGLEKAGGVQTKAADLLGMTERHLRYKLKKYGMK
ncbi:sigma-54-dependent Fis family transcriptional regulator [candidate division KSB1 bacterium]|nr:sigma-54-dependent Fis family transcriptional regulator [candidate division KSB1 bacterium]NIR69211.1 sigma-54-dependent Fis family transcriptional regulator [candidate division KSB1 bacterium]NIS27388.1 sigma-54-dependent Fis family transcriptional regulator [candidate division KSB1 bacterium]NIT74213.1 sigma-54-dependent Fis family transcriptional regulator [candidate division KSB1 bacterium]NIU28105.1 sigma-54-dependent Fis family transcriptional regulator [candidate division KSB1 bacteri